MHSHPFRLLEPFADKLNVWLFTKEDALCADRDAGTLLHVPFATVRQVHGPRTLIVDSAGEKQTDADGMATRTVNLALTIQSADCQTFLAYDPGKHVIGLLHAGWRGLKNGAIESFIETLRRKTHVDPADLLIAAGPSLCVQCSEFSHPKEEFPTIDPKFFHGRLVDLRAIADDTLQQCGVAKDHVERHPDCTRCNKEEWWSYRGEPDPVREGYRNVLAAMLL